MNLQVLANRRINMLANAPRYRLAQPLRVHCLRLRVDPRDPALVHVRPERLMPLTNLVADLARKAKSQEWLDFFDVLLGKDTQ